jgi:diguanylate cyclase (GGDEF)-like protein
MLMGGATNVPAVLAANQSGVLSLPSRSSRFDTSSRQITPAVAETPSFVPHRTTEPMAVQTHNITSKPTIVTAGLNGEFASWLRQQLGDIGVRGAQSLDDTLHTLVDSDCSLLVLNHTLSGPPALDVLSRVRANPDLADLPVIYFLDPILDSAMGRQLLDQLGVDHLFLHPLEQEKVAAYIRRLLNIPSEPSLPSPPGVAGEPFALPVHIAHSDHAFMLIVGDDVALTERIADEALTRGVRVEMATSAEQARRSVGLQRPDIVLLDLGLSKGTDAGLSLLRELNSLVPPIPVLVLTANDNFPDRVQVASLGGRGFLPESLQPSEVLDAVTRLLQQLRTHESHVMVVDDDPAILNLLRSLLEAEGIRVTTVDDPLRFWDTLEQVTPDLVMLDVDMPLLGGVKLCRVVRNDARWGALPVLLLTDHTDPDTVRNIFAAGADEIVAKPIVGPELVTKVVNRLERTLLYRSMAEIDPVTGVTNRRKSTDSLRQFLRLAQRHGQPLSLALLDLDLFKQINDRYGHATGDAVLQQLGKTLMRTFRSEDVVSRWGGEEFLIGMYGMTRADGVQRLTALLDDLHHQSLSGPRGEPISITFSAGVAQFPDDGSDLQSLYRAADAALYRAKQTGRDRVMPVGWQINNPQRTLHSVDVVLVADDEVHGGLLTQALEAHGYRTHWLRDGEAATLLLGGFNPALSAPVILVEADLPEIDGLGVIRRLSRDGALRHTRVIMLAARAQERDVSRAMALGAFDFVYRPYTLPVLMQRVRRAMEIL